MGHRGIQPTGGGYDPLGWDLLPSNCLLGSYIEWNSVCIYPDGVDEMKELTVKMKAAGDSNRLRILHLLSYGELSVSGLQ